MRKCRYINLTNCNHPLVTTIKSIATIFKANSFIIIMKILELCIYSAGIDGVFARVKQESQLLSKAGHEVKIFSSNHTKGSDKIAPAKDKLQKVEILRFPAKKLGGESFMSWNFEQEALKFKPDVIIAHSYRHNHTTKAQKIAKKLGCKVFLVTHAPFARQERSFLGKIAVLYYDNFIGRASINKFDKIIAITKWEIPYLLALGAKKDKIKYIPNGIADEFFKVKKAKEQNKILFLGRIAPIKSIETIIQALPHVKNNLVLEIVGPAEQEYLKYLKTLIKSNKLENRVIFSPAIYKTKEKIKKIDSAKIFVLPSKSEGMPQSLIEAMAREKIVIASDNLASKDLIVNEKNGHLFQIGNPKDLANKINLALEKNQNKIKKVASSSVLQFSWSNIIKKIEKLIQ